MSSDKSANKRSSKLDLIQSFVQQVPGRVSAILENWHQLVHSDWDNQLLDVLIERIATLAESGAKFGVSQISQSGNSLVGHLSDYHNTGLKPQHDDVVALDGLVHAFKDAAIQACNQQAGRKQQVTVGGVDQIEPQHACSLNQHPKHRRVFTGPAIGDHSTNRNEQ